ncbi:uncharacterized protein LOC143078171 [Mytilus galloprovincialis]|uniref:uncharacterized protein LOC143078171 n=1 Tax=Mytilus galloprovincialis TaxID=29158 RepID=UPI003F7C5D7E
MEPDMVVEMLKGLDDKDIVISQVVGDDDSTGFDRAKVLMPSSSMVKINDKNHIKHNIIKKVNDLKSKHRELSGMVAESIVKNVSYVLEQNNGNPEGIEKGFHATVNHMYGDHQYCTENWCGYLKNKQNYVHSNLPYGKDLSSASLKSDLEKLFIKQMVPQSDKLSQLGSSQANESVNNIIALKAPKTKHFSSSSSLNYRVSSAVLQKNEGYHYISELNTSIGLSPGNETIRRGSKLNLQRSKKKAKTQSKEWKKKRIFLKKKRAKRTVLSETKEGTTYQSSIGLQIDQKKDDIENIPDMPDDSHQVVTTGASLVVFDLETTGLSRYSDITQIAACNVDRIFSRYIFPNQPISAEASRITGLTVVGNKMYHNGLLVPYKLPHEGLTDFLSYISEFKDKPILIGHNIKRFDCHVLFNTLFSLNMWNEFSSQISCFIDSLNLFKQVVPGLASYSQSFLVNNLLGQEYESHNAVHDARLLLKLITDKGNISNYLDDLAFSPNYPDQYRLQLCNLKTYSKVIKEKVISKAMALKAAKSNLKLCHLKMSIDKGGKMGLIALLSEKSVKTGDVRVTKTRKYYKEYLITLKNNELLLGLYQLLVQSYM